MIDYSSYFSSQALEEELDKQLKPHLSTLHKLGNQIQSQVPEDSKQKFQDDLKDLEERSKLTEDKAAERLQHLTDLEGRWSAYDDDVEKFASWLGDVTAQLEDIEETVGSPEDTFNKAKVNRTQQW